MSKPSSGFVVNDKLINDNADKSPAAANTPRGFGGNFLAGIPPPGRFSAPIETINFFTGKPTTASVPIGQNALFESTTSKSNTAIGHSAPNNKCSNVSVPSNDMLVTSGSKNVAVRNEDLVVNSEINAALGTLRKAIQAELAAKNATVSRGFETVKGPVVQCQSCHSYVSVNSLGLSFGDVASKESAKTTPDNVPQESLFRFEATTPVPESPASAPASPLAKRRRR